ncbi:MAG: sensor histidine kinase, partial [Mucilaginibacter sp.]
NKIALSDAKLMDFLNIINSSIKKFSSLVKDIATIAKVESDMTDMESVKIDDVINNVEWSLEDAIQSSGAVINRDLKVDHIMFSKKNIRSIVYNLVSNAIKFKRDEPPVINISTMADGDNVVLTIQDNGIGMRKEDLNTIFEMYGRLHQDIEGHGIGLHLAKKIVDATGGNIIVESELGKGSKFMIYLKSEPELIA